MTRRLSSSLSRGITTYKLLQVILTVLVNIDNDVS